MWAPGFARTQQHSCPMASPQAHTRTAVLEPGPARSMRLADRLLLTGYGPTWQGVGPEAPQRAPNFTLLREGFTENLKGKNSW